MEHIYRNLYRAAITAEHLDACKAAAAEDAAEVVPDGFGMRYHGVFYRNTCMPRAAVYHEVAVRLYGRSWVYRCDAYNGNIWVSDHHACR